jgi:peptidoglycan hydrolase CwlO-like protein
LNKNYNGVTKVDNDFILKQFGEIEHKVSNLIENCKAQAAANSELKNKLTSLEEEIQGKVEAEKNYAEEKALIRSKIDGLLARLDDISEL